MKNTNLKFLIFFTDNPNSLKYKADLNSPLAPNKESNKNNWKRKLYSANWIAKNDIKMVIDPIIIFNLLWRGE